MSTHTPDLKMQRAPSSSRADRSALLRPAFRGPYLSARICLSRPSGKPAEYAKCVAPAAPVAPGTTRAEFREGKCR
jgi:hypothetical protein